MVSEYTFFRGAEGINKSSVAQKPQLGAEEILVKITHSGVCAKTLLTLARGDDVVPLAAPHGPMTLP
jgi:D-arabinose 1-dehydrogenase-like Zn-dependent alcohol dehydrogenase